MKIPASSSIILATLAISSSSASLAAPTGDATTGYGGSLQNANQAMENEDMADTSMVKRDLGDNLEARDGTNLADLLGSLPVVGPLITPFLAADCSNPDGPNAQSANSDPAAMQRLQDAVGTVSSVLSGVMPTGVPLPGIPVTVPSGAPIPPGTPLQNIAGAQAADDPAVGGDPNNTPTGPPAPDATPDGDQPQPAAAGDDSDGGSFLISPTTTIANAQEAAPTQDPDYLSATPASEDTSNGEPSEPPSTPTPATTAAPSE